MIGGGVATVLLLVLALLRRSGTTAKGSGPLSLVPRKISAGGGSDQSESVTLSRDKQMALQKVMTDRILKPLSGVMQFGSDSHSKLVERLVHAGIRKKGAAEVFLGAKVAMALAMTAASVAFLLWRSRTGGAELDPQNVILYGSGAMIIGLMLPTFWLSHKAKARMEKIRFALPDALDLLVVCIESGLALDAAFVRLARELKENAPELSEEITLMNLEISAGKPRDECMRNFGLRTGVGEAKALAARVIQTSRFGTNLASSLRIHAESLRQKRRQEAEERAAKTTVKLLFPLVFFIFPAIFVVILGPAMVRLAQGVF
jgi:tight adherence protein C